MTTGKIVISYILHVTLGTHLKSPLLRATGEGNGREKCTDACVVNEHIFASLNFAQLVRSGTSMQAKCREMIFQFPSSF